MGSLLGSLSSLATPELINAAAGLIPGVGSDLVGAALKSVGPAVVGGLAKKAATPEGLNAIMGMVAKADPAMLDDVVGTAMKFLGNPEAAKMLSGLLGSDASALVTQLSRATGVNLGSLVPALAPLAIGAVSKFVTSNNLDAAGVKKALNAEVAEMRTSTDPAVRNALTALDNVAAQDALKAKVSDKEWRALSMAPALAAGYVLKASKTGPIGSGKELAAFADALDGLTVKGGSALVDGILADISDKVGDVVSSGNLDALGIGDLDFSDAAAVKSRVLDQIGLAKDALAKMPADEVAAYKKFIMDGAEKVAASAKEGGFLGIGGTDISEGEVAALNQLKRLLA